MRERGRRVHFCSSVSARRLQRTLGWKHRGSRSPISEPAGEGREAGSQRAGGARSPRAWPARGAVGGAPREGPRRRARCPMKSCRLCRDLAMAVSARGFRGSWVAPSPRTELERPRGPGTCRGAAAVWLVKLGAEVGKGREQRLPALLCKFPIPSWQPGPSILQTRMAADAGSPMGQIRLGFWGFQVRSSRP